ncbi:MAG: multiheme c-type cytochrome [Phycisphaerae bacterium]|nr:multiheme c-type cytochrome [Phycisphaerae bacterium]
MSSVPRAKFVAVVGPRLKIVLMVVFALFALLVVNSVYLGAVTFAGWRSGVRLENYFYLWMFMAHLALGVAFTAPVIVFGLLHAKNAHNRPNVWAKRVGWTLFVVAIVVLVTGFLLTRVEVGGLTIGMKDPLRLDIAYWTHIITPIAAIWLFVLHRLAGRRIRWKVGVTWGAIATLFAFGMVFLHSLDPRDANQPGPKSGEEYFRPSLARTATGNFIPERSLMMNQYCLECHADTHKSWSHSVHAFSSFNNPFYTFSVRETRRVGHERDGNVTDARFCAGCHDPVPFFSGSFDLPKWDDPDYDVARDPLGAASISCTVCHSITHVNGTRGNADYTIEESPQYPFTFSESPILQWVNRQLIKAKPGFHKQTYLKPEVHRSDEFCSTCHKVHLPIEVNDYKWLRGQNHYDSFRLSGVSGIGALSWYYPPKSETDCNGCHMQAIASDDFGAKMRPIAGDATKEPALTIKNHQFPSANPAIAWVLNLPERDAILAAAEAFNKGVMRVDIVALHEDAAIDGALHAPLRPEVPALEPGKSYLIDVVTRTLKMGHEFTQGTADSNEVWLEVTAREGGRIIGKSGGLGGREDGNGVDPWSKFLNIFMLDRNGFRVDRRNPQDIFVPLYNNQIPPGAGDVTHYVLRVPPDAKGPITFDVALRYRKFDTIYMRYVFGPERINDLPILTLATDSVVFPVAGSATASAVVNEKSSIDPWQRWYDYGIGLIRTADRGAGKGELRQAEAAFREVEQLGRPEGPLGRARVYVREGRLEEAVTALGEAAAHIPPAYPWSVAWFSGIVAKQQGNLDEAIGLFRQVIASDWPLARERGFDFARDDRVRNELAETLLERARLERGEEARERRVALLSEAEEQLRASLREDAESATAHYLLAQVLLDLGDEAGAAEHLTLHARYKPDDNARDRAVAAARARYPAADKAAEAIVLFDLNRQGAYGLSANTPSPSPLSSAEVAACAR